MSAHPCTRQSGILYWRYGPQSHRLLPPNCRSLVGSRQTVMHHLEEWSISSQFTLCHSQRSLQMCTLVACHKPVPRLEACTCAVSLVANTASSSQASFGVLPGTFGEGSSSESRRRPSAIRDDQLDWTCLRSIHRWKSCVGPCFRSSCQMHSAMYFLTLSPILWLASRTLSGFRLAQSWSYWEPLMCSKCHLYTATLSH